jgi:hypothetical protein
MTLVSLMAEDRAAPLAEYDRDTVFRARIMAAYLTDRPRFISSVIALAVSKGYGRQEAVAFANAVTASIRAELSAAGKDTR